MVFGLGLAPGATADGIEDCGLTESDQFVGVLLVTRGIASPRKVHLFQPNADGRGPLRSRSDGTFAAYGGDEGYTAVEAGFSFLVRLPPGRFKRWPVEPHCEFTVHHKNIEAYDGNGYVFKLGPEDLGIERAEWEQWDFDANGLTAFRQFKRANHYGGITWTKRGGPVEPFEMEEKQNEVLADAGAGCPDLPEEEATVAVWRTRSGCWGGCGPAGCTDISKKELGGVLAVVYDESFDSLGESCKLPMAEGAAAQQINPGVVTIHRLNRRLRYGETNAQLAWRNRDKGDGAVATDADYREGDCHF